MLRGPRLAREGNLGGKLLSLGISSREIGARLVEIILDVSTSARQTIATTW